MLDNFEQLVEVGRNDLTAWLSRLPGLHLLVTSRRALGLDGEVEQALPALSLPTAGAALHEHALNPAVALFADRARAVRADFHLNERNHALVAAIVRELQGLPLAVLTRGGSRAADDSHHASMLRVVEWSWRHLDPGSQALLGWLAAFDGGATLRAVQAMRGDADAACVAGGLDDLVAASVA